MTSRQVFSWIVGAALFLSACGEAVSPGKAVLPSTQSISNTVVEGTRCPHYDGDVVGANPVDGEPRILFSRDGCPAGYFANESGVWEYSVTPATFSEIDGPRQNIWVTFELRVSSVDEFGIITGYGVRMVSGDTYVKDERIGVGPFATEHIRELAGSFLIGYAANCKLGADGVELPIEECWDAVQNGGLHREMVICLPNGGVACGPPSEDFTTTPVLNRLPTATINASPSSRGTTDPECAAYHFSAGMSDPDEDPLSYSWEFDDAPASGAGTLVGRTFCGVGTHTARLLVADPSGGLDIDVFAFEIKATTTPPPPPDSANPLTITNFEGPDRVGPFQNCGYLVWAAEGVPPYTYTWLVNGKAVRDSAARYERYVYTNAGMDYTIAVRVSDAAGSSAVAERFTVVDPALEGRHCISP